MNNTKQIAMAGVMMAAVFVVTRFIQIPIPLGYFNVGNSVILLFCLLVESPYGVVASAVGSGLADLTSFPVYTLPTVIIKAIMPILFYIIVKKMNKNAFGILLAAAISTLIPLFGYTITGGIIYGNLIAGLAQFPGLALEYAANLIIIAVLHQPVVRAVKMLAR